MTQYIPLDSILDNIPKAVRKEVDDLNLLSYALDGYRLLNVPMEYQKTILVKKIDNHNVELPSDIKTINLITWTNEFDCPEDLSNNLQPISNGEYNIYYQIWYDSNFYNQRFLPLRNVGNSSSLNCTSCNNPLLSRCSESFSILPDNTLLCSIKDGWLCIDYDKIIKDVNGNFLIIKSPEIKNYLTLYAITQSWFERSMSKEEGAFQMYNTLLQQTEIAFKKAKGSQILKNIDIHTINQISGTETYNQRLMRLPTIFYKKYNI